MNLHCLCCLSHYIADHKKKPEVQFWSRAWNNILHYPTKHLRTECLVEEKPNANRKTFYIV